MKKKFVKAFAIIFLLIVLVGMGSSCVITGENEYTVIRQFGKINKVIDEPGLSLKIPYLQTTTTLPNKILLYDLATSDVITMDKKTMVVDCFVLWQIEDPLRFAQTLNSSILNAEGRINTTVYNSIKNVISSLSQNDVISGRDGKLSESIMINVGTSMEAYGIALLSIETKHLDLPSDNKSAVYERMISERDKIAATYTAEGNSEAQIIKNTTDKEVAISVSEAEASAEKIIAEGEAEYMRILAEAYNTEGRSDFYSFVRSLDAAKIALAGEDKTLILGPDSPIAQIFYGK